MSRTVNPDMLLDYRNAVGKNRRILVNNLDRGTLNLKVFPDNLGQLVESGEVLANAEGLLAYWGRRRVSELLLMPPTRQVMVNLNEARLIKK